MWKARKKKVWFYKSRKKYVILKENIKTKVAQVLECTATLGSAVLVLYINENIYSIKQPVSVYYMPGYFCALILTNNGTCQEMVLRSKW